MGVDPTHRGPNPRSRGPIGSFSYSKKIILGRNPMSEIDDLILISVDDHIIEPPDIFVNHLPAAFQDRAPKLVRNEEGSDVWVYGQVVMETAALNAVAGRPREEYGLEPQSLDEVRPGCYDVHERVKDMNAGGVLASMNFPSFPTFTARVFASDDPDLSLALVRAYNDWHIDEWCGAHPGRFIPMGSEEHTSELQS